MVLGTEMTWLYLLAFWWSVGMRGGYLQKRKWSREGGRGSMVISKKWMLFLKKDQIPLGGPVENPSTLAIRLQPELWESVFKPQALLNKHCMSPQYEESDLQRLSSQRSQALGVMNGRVHSFLSSHPTLH